MSAGRYGELLNRLDQNPAGLSPEFLKVYRELLRVQSGIEESVSINPPNLPGAVVAERREKGLPLLAFADFAPDWHVVQDAFAGVAAVFACNPEVFGESARKLEVDPARLKQAVQTWYEGTSMPLSGSEDLSPILGVVIHAAMQPFLIGYTRVCRDLVDQERWRRGYCPICGGTPDFAYLEKENGARRLLCSRCDMDWLFQRLQCPYCNNIDQNSLAYFTDDSGLYRLYVCEQCHHYLKALDLRQAKPDILFPLERLLTLGLDSQAQQQGYSPPDYSGVVSKK